LIILVVLISLFYFILIVSLLFGFTKVTYFKGQNNAKQQRFTVVIPFRNESENLKDLAESLEQLNYPKVFFEVIWINDDSTDNSVKVLESFIERNKHFILLNNINKSKSPKKDAIKTAIDNAKYPWIITTDADCEVPINWLKCFSEFIAKHNNVKMIVGPVAYKTNNSFLQNFQDLDFLSLIGSTIGGFGIGKPFLCNGANLCYLKDAFLTVNGFEGNNHIASGDDIFLMEKILVKYPNLVNYLKSKDAVVITKPETTFKALLSQRIRWASKTVATKNGFGKFVGAVVFLMNVFILLILIYGFWFWNYKLLFLMLLAVKLGIDFLLIQKTSRFLQQKNKLFYYSFSALCYPFFVVLVVFLSLFKKQEWKGRKFDVK
jgi:cellulose synthase/poly-beta-1,6-N-acetylglucosamine synthase-like glycosyltransferase